MIVTARGRHISIIMDGSSVSSQQAEWAKTLAVPRKKCLICFQCRKSIFVQKERFLPACRDRHRSCSRTHIQRWCGVCVSSLFVCVRADMIPGTPMLIIVIGPSCAVNTRWSWSTPLFQLQTFSITQYWAVRQWSRSGKMSLRERFYMVIPGEKITLKSLPASLKRITSGKSIMLR